MENVRTMKLIIKKQLMGEDNMKVFDADITVKFTQCGLNAKNEDHAIKVIKEIYKEVHDIKLTNEEIKIKERK